VLLFDGDRIAGLGEPGRPDRHPRRVLWAGVCFGFAAAVKIWAGIPALVAWVLCLTARPGRPPRPALSFAGGFAAGILVPCLPFEILAPSGFGRTVFVSELVQATHGRVGANPRVADITGIIGLSSVGVNPRIWQGVTAAAVVFLFVVMAWVRARRGGIRATALDWFALVTTIVVTRMLSPRRNGTYTTRPSPVPSSSSCWACPRPGSARPAGPAAISPISLIGPAAINPRSPGPASPGRGRAGSGWSPWPRCSRRWSTPWAR
jgi:hypothetical protein